MIRQVVAFWNLPCNVAFLFFLTIKHFLIITQRPVYVVVIADGVSVPPATRYPPLH